MNKNISFDEMKELWEAGLVIHDKWISPYEGYEYRVLIIGDWDHTIAFRKSPRAAYNAAKKYLAAQPGRAPDAAIASANPK